MGCLSPIFAAAGAAALLSAAPALADTYDLSFSETSALGPAAYEVVLDTARSVVLPNGTAFGDVTISRDGQVLPSTALSVFDHTEIASSYFFLVDTDTPTRDLYTGVGNSLKFNVGDYSIADGATDGEGRLTIADTSVSAAPEPGAWALMMLGVAGLGAALRFRRRGDVQVATA